MKTTGKIITGFVILGVIYLCVKSYKERTIETKDTYVQTEDEEFAPLIQDNEESPNATIQEDNKVFEEQPEDEEYVQYEELTGR
jgi:hypothetical protein